LEEKCGLEINKKGKRPSITWFRSWKLPKQNKVKQTKTKLCTLKRVAGRKWQRQDYNKRKQTNVQRRRAEEWGHGSNCGTFAW
jgi:hypothetical protein